VRPHAVRERVHHPISLTRANGADGEASAPFAFLEALRVGGTRRTGQELVRAVIRAHPSIRPWLPQLGASARSPSAQRSAFPPRAA